jgi:hypothetical protein
MASGRCKFLDSQTLQGDNRWNEPFISMGYVIVMRVARGWQGHR